MNNQGNIHQDVQSTAVNYGNYVNGLVSELMRTHGQGGIHLDAMPMNTRLTLSYLSQSLLAMGISENLNSGTQKMMVLKSVRQIQVF